MISSFFIENSKGPLNFNTNPDAHFEDRILQSARTRLQSRVTSLLVIINFLAIIARREKSFSELVFLVKDLDKDSYARLKTNKNKT